MSRSRSKPRSKSRKRKRVAKTQTGLVIPDGAKRCLAFDEGGNELWAIENILNEREVDGKPQYLVKWEGWPYRYCTWETEESFLENMDIIKNYVKEKNEGIRRIFKGIDLHGARTTKKKQKKPAASRKNKFQSSTKRKDSNESTSRLRSRSTNSCTRRVQTRSTRSRRESSRSVGRPRRIRKRTFSDHHDTKIVIQKITLPGESGLIEVVGNKSNLNGEIPENSISYLNPTTKPMDIFICRDADDIQLEQPQECEERKKPAEVSDSDDDYFEDIEDDSLSKASLRKSVCNDFAVPLVENEFENGANFKIVIEECFTKSSGQIESLRFKVAFYDNEGSLKGYDYFSYEEIKQKNWAGALLDFYARELLSEVSPNCSYLTQNIKVV